MVLLSQTCHSVNSDASFELAACVLPLTSSNFILPRSWWSSLRLVPSSSDKTASVQDTSNSLGLHDALQYGPRSLATEARAQSQLKQRLDNWEETQDDLKLNIQRDLYGLHAPVRLMMERKIVSTNMHMPALPRSNIHLDILMGRDESLDIADIFGETEVAPPMDIHGQMERKLRM
ncbi:proteasome maturation factor UMP1-domain-containing protein [Phellopilus nigrolimitatus]|nr:proteasome maturation factor UMP1-domain-containing protein [Phellopilus nigrolimitatus]